jgi:hypothetical protein
MRLSVKFLALTLGLVVTQSLAADPPKTVKLETLLADPAAYEGKPIIIRATVAGAVVEGAKYFRLAVDGHSAAVGVNRGVADAVNFVVQKDQKEKLLKNWKTDVKYTADLTVTLQGGKGKDKHWFAVVSEISIKDSGTAVNGGTKPPVNDEAKPVIRPVIQVAVPPETMSLRQLLEAYDPSEADNAIGQRLAKITKGEPCIVFDKAGGVIVEASEALVKELKDGFKPRQTYSIKSVPYKTYKVGEAPNKLFAENPLYPGSALRSDGMCDSTERTWQGVPQSVRQVIYLAVTKTGEIKIEKPDDAHAILDKLAGTPPNAEKWVKARYSKAYLLYDDLKARGELPSLKLSSVQRPATEEPKPTTTQPPKPPTAQPST